jgi:DNA-binding NarL/FixJ family response regulator
VLVCCARNHQTKVKQRILFVEDEVEFAGVVKDLRKTVDALFLKDAELVVLQSLEMMKHVLKTNNVILIVMDLTLPDSKQEQSIELIAKESMTMPPIVVLTGDERIDVRRQCIFAGASGFALKRHVIESPNFFFSYLYNTYLIGLGHGH